MQQFNQKMHKNLSVFVKKIQFNLMSDDKTRNLSMCLQDKEIPEI